MQQGNVPINFDALNAYKRSIWTVDTHWKLYAAIMIFVPLLFMPLILLDFPGIASGILTDLFLFLVVSAIIVVVILFYQRIARLRRETETMFRAFAAANQMTYDPSGEPVGKVGSLFDVGSSKRVLNVLSGNLQGLPFSSYEYYYETGSGKSRQMHDAMVFELTLPRVVPHFVIDSAIERVLPIYFAKSQKIELEGDFHKYFDVYAPDNYSISALTILAPDAMEVLMQHTALCDVEIVQNKLYFYWQAPAGNRQQYEQLFTTASAVMKKIGKKLTSADIYAAPSQGALHAQPAANGVRLKRSPWPAVLTAGTVIAVIMLQFADVFFPKTSSNAGDVAPFISVVVGLVIFLAVPAILIYAVIYTRRREQLLKDYKAHYGKRTNP